MINYVYRVGMMRRESEATPTQYSFLATELHVDSPALTKPTIPPDKTTRANP